MGKRVKGHKLQRPDENALGCRVLRGDLSALTCCLRVAEWVGLRVPPQSTKWQLRDMLEC